MTAFDTIVIGAGPGGYPAAAIAAAVGENVAIIERSHLGGTCLNCGCIPTKALCRSAQVADDVASASAYGVMLPEGVAAQVSLPQVIGRKQQVVEELRMQVSAVLSGCTVIAGEARFVEPHVVAVGEQLYTAPRIVIATGAAPASLRIEGAELAVDSSLMLDSTMMPASLAIIGGGVIGMEFASVFASFGVEVTVLEYFPEVLANFDRDVAKRLRSAMQRRGVKFITRAEVKALRSVGDDRVEVEYLLKDKVNALAVSRVLMAVGRRPVIPAGAAEVGFELSPRGFVVDERMQTNHPGVFAVGDCNGLCQLAHAATAQARMAMGEDVNLSVIPSAVFTHPECAMVGLTQAAAEELYAAQGLDAKARMVIGKAMFAGNGKALTMGQGDGFVKVIADGLSGQILGVHIIGPHASDLIAEAALAISAGLSLSDIRRTIHAHPTLSELLEAALPHL